MSSPLKIVSLIEAATLNAVARINLEFFRTADEWAAQDPECPAIDASVVTFDRNRAAAQPSEFVAATRAAGIEIDVIPERRRFDLSVIPALKQIIEKLQPDLVITNSVKSHFLFWRSRLAKEYPWIAFHHGYTATDQKMRLYNRLDRWSLPKADRVVTVCQAFARELAATAKLRESDIFVQHNAIRPRRQPDAHAVTALRGQLGIAENERVILSVGRLSREKAHDNLIEAFAQLRALAPELDLKLVIAGDGPQRDALESQARLAANGQIVFAG